MAPKITIHTINIDKLKALTEKELRKLVMLPLLDYIGVQNVMDLHGSNEKGIDVYFEVYDAFGHKN